MHKKFHRVSSAAVLVCLALGTGCASKLQPAPVVETNSVSLPAIEKKISGLRSTDEIVLFDGKNLGGWKPTDFGGHGEIFVTNNEIRVEMGAELSGISWTNHSVLPKTNYEIELDAMKRDGGDFFCGLTMPVGDSFCTFIVGGWGGAVVGISSLDGADASENETTKSFYFEKDRWFHLRVRVTPEKILAWIDGEKIVDVAIAGKKISMRRGEIEISAPLGLATWQTSASYKNIRLKNF
ncbi:MAG: DUF1080 domain-containing protein [Verrucomicrobiota bacterium]